MSKIYVDQTALRIQISLNISLVNSKECYIKCKKPNGDMVSWVATKGAGNSIYYDVVSGDLNMPGEFTMWPYIIFNDDSAAPGSPSSISIYEEGT